MMPPQRIAQLPIRPDWLATRNEPALEPGQALIDAHHHLFDRPGNRYLLDDLLEDLGAGHRVVGTVFVQARAAYRTAGPEALRPVGETEFAREAGEAAASRGAPGVAAAIVGFADLTLGDAVRPVLEAHVRAAGGRFRGIRHVLAWDHDVRLLNPAYPTTEDMMDSPAFRAGLAQLAAMGLGFDAWLHQHQIPRLAALAGRMPDLPIVLDHCGGVLGAGLYEGRRDEGFASWSKAIRDLAARPNVTMKIGGLGMGLSGFGFDRAPRAPSSQELAAAWRPWVETCIDAFGAARCMFESNFPADKASYGYVVGWNAMKRLAAGATLSEKADLFWRSAARFYRIDGFAGIAENAVPFPASPALPDQTAPG
ncbi:amidohydrolase family protein [Pseudochelatococcus sp. B33]